MFDSLVQLKRCHLCPQDITAHCTVQTARVEGYELSEDVLGNLSNVRLVKHLLNLGLYPNLCNVNGESVLQLLFKRNLIDYAHVVRFLLNKGADFYHRDNSGKSTLEIIKTWKIKAKYETRRAVNMITKSHFRRHSV